MNLFDTVAILEASGYAGLFGIIFSETSVLIGFFLPGDSLLFGAGFLASAGYLNITLVILVTFVAAVLGDSVGYALGRKYGYKIFKREDSLFFHKDNIERAGRFYEAHGGKTVVIARFLPIIRTITPILAGVGRMPYPTFVGYNVLGAMIWTVSLSLFGYYLGKFIPGPDRYLLPIIVGVIVLSVLSLLIAVLQSRKKRAQD